MMKVRILKPDNALRLLRYLLVTTLLCNPVLAQTEEQTEETEFLRGYISQNGIDNCNPCVDNVIHSINTLRNRGETLGFNWGADYPPVEGAGTKNHWQGIQRLTIPGLEVPYLVVASSHRTFVLTGQGQVIHISAPARFAVVEMGSRGNDGRRLRSNRLEPGSLTRDVSPNSLDLIVRSHEITPEYDHPGGMQAIGKYLLVASDGNIEHSRDTALFTLWDLSNPYSPRDVWVPRWELPIREANSVGMVRLENGHYLMLRALGDAKKLEFYILDGDLEVSPGSYYDGLPWDRWDYSELQSELFNSDGSLNLRWADLGSILGQAGYQNTNIVTECGSGTLYLIASHGRRPSGLGGADFIDAYRLDIPAERPNPDRAGEGVVITKVANRRMFLDENAGARQGDLQAAGGVYVSPDNKLYFYACEHGPTSDGNFVEMIEFGPEEPLSEVRFIDDAWVELYDEANFDGRSIILDYVDRRLRDYHDFDNIEEFDDLASSVIYAIPLGYRLRLFANTQEEGGYLDLVGSGVVERIEDLGDLVFTSGDSASNQISSAKWLSVVTTLDEEQIVFPASFELYQNYPNPFNGETVINYEIPKETELKIEIYDIRGQLIRTLVHQRQSAGFYSAKWDGKDILGNDVASGTYLYRLEMEEYVKVRKLTLVR